MPPARMRVLTGVGPSAARTTRRRSTRRCSARSSRCPGSSRPTTAASAARAAERRHVVGGVAGAARHDLGGVVLEDQHRRLARHARDAAVDEFIRHDVADDGDGPAPQRADEGEELRRIHPTASIRLLRIASGSDRPGRRLGAVGAVARAHEQRPHARRMAARHVDQPVAHHERARGIEAELTAGLLDHARARLAAPAHHAVLGQLGASGWCGQK